MQDGDPGEGTTTSHEKKTEFQRLLGTGKALDEGGMMEPGCGKGTLRAGVNLKGKLDEGMLTTGTQERWEAGETWGTGNEKPGGG